MAQGFRGFRGFRGVAPRASRSPQDIFVNKEALIGALIVVASGAGAETLCRFETECFEADECAVSAFELRLDAARTVMGTEFGDLAVVAEAGGALIAEGTGAVYMLSIEEAGARLSVQMEGPMVVSYLGACE